MEQNYEVVIIGGGPAGLLPGGAPGCCWWNRAATWAVRSPARGWVLR